MTRALPTVVGLTLLALAPARTEAQVASSLDEVVGTGRFTQGGAATPAGWHGDADCALNAKSLYSKVHGSEPSSKEPAFTGTCRTGNAARTDFRKRDRPRVAARGVFARRLSSASKYRLRARGALRPSLQGGLFVLARDGWASGGGFFGAGVTASPFLNLALLGDGHLVGGPDGAAFYGSGTVALRGVIPSRSAEEIASVAGVGLGLFTAGGYVAAGPQFVFGLDGKAGFGQIRVLRFSDGVGAFVLLGGFRF